jgi:hypothetical protein
MSDTSQSITAVRYKFHPYDYGAVRRLLKYTTLDFGAPGSTRRWQFVTAQTPSTESNAWIIDFHFRDPHDAMIFALKYQK